MTTKVAGDMINDLPAAVVATADIQDSAVTAAKLATDAVETAKIKDLNVTTGKLANNAVDHTKVAAGAVVQTANTQSGAVATGTTVLPFDDTIPQSGEGIEFLTLAITPKSATNKLKIDVVINLANSAAGGQLIAALFRDSGADALAASAVYYAGGGQIHCIKFTHYMTSPGTSETTFKVRAGGNNAGTTTLNGTAGGRQLGGVMASSITITEFKA